MEYTLLEHPEAIREKFKNRFTMSWEDYQIKRKDWIAQAKKYHFTVDKHSYETGYMWENIDPAYPRVSMAEALAFLRKKNRNVLFMSEDAAHYGSQNIFALDDKHISFVAQATSYELSAQIEREWNLIDELITQEIYPFHLVLPQDLYLFSPSMTWCVVFTHEERDTSAEIGTPMNRADNRYCIICKL